MAEIEISLTEKEQSALRKIALDTGKTEHELIHDAVDKLIKQGAAPSHSGMLKARGIWKDRKDLPDFKQIRKELDRL